MYGISAMAIRFLDIDRLFVTIEAARIGRELAALLLHCVDACR